MIYSSQSYYVLSHVTVRMWRDSVCVWGQLEKGPLDKGDGDLKNKFSCLKSHKDKQ